MSIVRFSFRVSVGLSFNMSCIVFVLKVDCNLITCLFFVQCRMSSGYAVNIITMFRFLVQCFFHR